jgi:hypothetical protein
LYQRFIVFFASSAVIKSNTEILAIPSIPPKTGGGNRQHAAAELVYINMEKCNFFREKIEGIAKHYFSEIVIYYKKVHKDYNLEIKALKCFSKNPYALTRGVKGVDPI